MFWYSKLEISFLSLNIFKDDYICPINRPAAPPCLPTPTPNIICYTFYCKLKLHISWRSSWIWGRCQNQITIIMVKTTMSLCWPSTSQNSFPFQSSFTTVHLVNCLQHGQDLTVFQMWKLFVKLCQWTVV